MNPNQLETFYLRKLKNIKPILIFHLFTLILIRQPSAWSQGLDIKGEVKIDASSIPFSQKPLAPTEEIFPVYLQEAEQELKKEFAKISSSGPIHSSQLYQDFLFKEGKKKAQGLIFLDHPITLDEFNSAKELIDSLDEAKKKNPKKADEKGAHESKGEEHTLFFKKLEQELVKIAAYQRLGIKNNLTAEETVFNPAGVRVVMEPLNFEALLGNLNKDDSQHQAVKNLFQILTADQTLLGKIPYLDPSDAYFNNSCNNKEQDLSHVLNQVVEFQIPAHQNKLIEVKGVAARDHGHYADHYRGKSTAFKSELLYKLKVMAKKVEEAAQKKKITPEEKTFIIQQLLHAGRHCPDAKAQVFNEVLFPMVCPDEWDELLKAEYPQQDRRAQAYLLASKEKVKALDELIRETMQKKAKGDKKLEPAESMTFRASTWDALAPQIGVPRLNATYGGGFVRNDITLKDFYDYYQPKKLIESYVKANSSRWEQDLGPLMLIQDVNYKNFMALAELKKYGLVEVSPIKGGAEEKALRKADPSLISLKLLNPQQYEQEMVVRGLEKGYPALVEAYLERQMLLPPDGYVFKYLLEQGNTFQAAQGNQNQGQDKKQDPLQDQKGVAGAQHTPKIAPSALPAIILFLKKNSQYYLQTPSLLTHFVNAGLENLTAYLLQNGLQLTEADLKYFREHPRKGSADLLKKLNVHAETVRIMEEMLAKGPAFPPGFEESFRTPNLMGDGKTYVWSKVMLDAHGKIKALTWYEATSAEQGCPPPSRLPTVAEYKALRRLMGYDQDRYNPDYFGQGHQSFRGTSPWSSESDGNAYAWYFGGNFGVVYNGNRSCRDSFRCVAEW
jgi:hypothetical protein